MKIVNGTLQYNAATNSLLWVCVADDGTLWVRTPDDKWGQVQKNAIVDFSSIQADFDTWSATHPPLSSQAIEQDITSSATQDNPVSVVPTQEGNALV